MITSRRSFLIGATSLLAVPAIVRAENLMKIVAPKPEYQRLRGFRVLTVDEMIRMKEELLQRMVFPPMVMSPLGEIKMLNSRADITLLHILNAALAGQHGFGVMT